MNDCKGNALPPPSSTLEQSTLLISTPEFHYNLPDDNADFSHFQMVTIDPKFVSEIKGPQYVMVSTFFPDCWDGVLIGMLRKQ